MRKDVKRAKVQLINNLNDRAKRLIEKKGTEKETEQNVRKSGRLKDEIKVLRHIDIDEVSKFALCSKLEQKDVFSQFDKLGTDQRAMLRLAHHKPVQSHVLNFRETYGVPVDKLILLIRSLGLKYQKKRSLKKEVSEKTLMQGEAEIVKRVNLKKKKKTLVAGEDGEVTKPMKVKKEKKRIASVAEEKSEAAKQTKVKDKMKKSEMNEDVNAAKPVKVEGMENKVATVEDGKVKTINPVKKEKMMKKTDSVLKNEALADKLEKVVLNVVHRGEVWVLQDGEPAPLDTDNVSTTTGKIAVEGKETDIIDQIKKKTTKTSGNQGKTKSAAKERKRVKVEWPKSKQPVIDKKVGTMEVRRIDLSKLSSEITFENSNGAKGAAQRSEMPKDSFFLGGVDPPSDDENVTEDATENQRSWSRYSKSENYKNDLCREEFANRRSRRAAMMERSSTNKPLLRQSYSAKHNSAPESSK